MELRNANDVNSRDIASDIKTDGEWSMSFWLLLSSQEKWLMRVKYGDHGSSSHPFIDIRNSRIQLYLGNVWKSSEQKEGYYSVHVTRVFF